MNTIIAERMQQIKPSATLAVSARASALKAQGQNIIDLSVGEPDFDTPDNIKQAAILAIQEGFTKYTAVDGIAGLKQAIVNKFKNENQLNYDLAEVMVSTGAKQCIYNVLQVLINPGDEVIIPAPYWVSYPDMVLLAEGVPVPISTTYEHQFKITPEQLENAITPHTKLLILNSPSNPTGMAYSMAELKKLAEVLLRHPHVWIMSDDIYEHILWSGEAFINIINACPALQARTLVINGVSKSYAMTGWRIGYAAGPKPIINEMKKVQSQSTSNPNSIAQVAAKVALEGDQSSIKSMAKIFKERHDYVVKALNEISGITCAPADGAFYAFPYAQALIDRLQLKDDIALAEFLLERAQIAVIPGSAFGAPGCFRISYATSMENLKEAMNRLKQAVI